MRMKRRVFLQGALACSTIGLTVGSGLLIPKKALASWPQQAFSATDTTEAIQAMYAADTEASDAIDLKVNARAENAASFPVKVTTSLPAESITILVDENPIPLIATFQLTPAVEPYVSVRVKMRASSNVIAVVKADDKLYKAEKFVEVTKGGCAC